jgi:putative hydrolase of the HAD superfamily
MSLALPTRRSLDAVLLDAGGVLVDPEWNRVAEILRAHDIDVSAEALALAEPRAKRRLDEGEHIARSTDDSRHPSFFGLVLEGAGWKGALPVSALDALRAEHARHNLWRRVLPGVPEALARLRTANLRLAVVSNANGTVPQLFAETGLAPYFEHLLDSFLEQIEKPDPRIFRRALERLGVDAARTLHAGDLYHVDVVGARAAGIAPALIDAGDLYGDADCPRFPSLPALVDTLLAER